MTVFEWMRRHFTDMFTERSRDYVHGFVPNLPKYNVNVYDQTGHRDKIHKEPARFEYRLWDTLLFSAEYITTMTNERTVMYTLYPCYNSYTTRDRLNKIAYILRLPVKFSCDNDGIYADDMRCDYIFVYPHEIVYHVCGADENYLVIKRIKTKKKGSEDDKDR